MSSGRRQSRERALQALYQLELKGASTPAEALEQAWAASAEEGPRDEETNSFALELVKGVQEHLKDVDELIKKHSHNWKLDRMSRIDRNVLRLGVFELKYRDDIPSKVSLNEAVELGKKFGGEQSSAFINGLLDKLAQDLNKK
jgi:transcription antitermination protein NusB